MTPHEDQKRESAFHYTTLYPNAKAIFSMRVQSIREIKDECIVVLDTNVLLAPYAFDKRELGEIATTYRNLKSTNRLVVPGQVAREFAQNRPSKLVDLMGNLKKQVGNTKLPGKNPLLGELQEYQKVIDLGDQVTELLRSYDKAIEKVRKCISDWTWNDPVSNLYRELFSDDVVLDSEFNQEEVMNDFEVRIRCSIPPGYKDSSKDVNAIGDFLIWRTILELGASRKKSVLFVTGDAKSDWWHKADGSSLYPRYELVYEFGLKSDGQSFHMTTLAGILELYGANPDVVSQVRSSEEITQLLDSESLILGSLAEKVVFMWAMSVFNAIEYVPDRSISRPPVGDFILIDPDGKRRAFEVVTERFRRGHIESIVSNFLSSRDIVDELILVCVVNGPLSAPSVLRRLEDAPWIRYVTLVIGYIDDQGGFNIV